MDTIQLTLIWERTNLHEVCFKACIPQTSCLQVFHITQSLFIANVDTSDKPGSHWVAFYFTKDHEGEFFDSYGSPPNKYSETFTTFLNNNSNQLTFNTVTLQNIYLKVCGHYWLYFALYCSRQIGMRTIVHRFSKNTSKNDSLVKQHFPISFPKYRTDVNEQRAQH